jgi:hypothetical protein
MEEKTSIITTINDIENTFIQDFIDEGYKCIIVGDTKTNELSYKNKKNIHYIPSVCKLFPEVSKALPCNHYCRKNLGYLHAIRQGIKLILDTDDDNFLKSDIYNWKKLKNTLVVEPSIPNILNYFSEANIWSRGYPLELINKQSEIAFKKINETDINKVGIIQSLVDGDPDVDAIFRLTSNEYTSNFKFLSGKSCTFNKGVYSQGNTQATLWVNPQLFHLLYIPVTVSFRFCDILKMYVAQRCMWEYDSLFAVTSPFFHQTRNAHDYMKDFDSEISMYKSLYKLLTNTLPSVKLKGEVEDIIRVYEALEKEGIVKKEELVTLKIFLKNIKYEDEIL